MKKNKQKSEVLKVAKKVGHVFLYIASAIALVKLAKFTGVEIENGEVYLAAAFNLAFVTIKELFEAKKK